jgi:hypothetical protein
MRSLLVRIVPYAFLALLASVPLTASASEKDADTDKVVESVEVKQAQIKQPKHPTLQFLKDNRVFLRAQLDRLRLQITRVHTGEGELLDARYLRLKEMSDAIAAARDTVRADRKLTAERELLDSVTQLGDLESQLTQMERLVAEQQTRLLALEADFLGHQETALVILLKGFSGKPAPTSIVLAEENDIVRVALTPDQQASLEKGGIAQIYHEFVEPRPHVYAVNFTGGPWDGTQAVAVDVEPTRDRLTFLELDCGELDRNRESLGLLTNTWYR